jgi:L-malate glycosyltransferase
VTSRKFLEKIAIVAPGEYFGGAERQILYLCEYLQQRAIPFDLILLCDLELAAKARSQGIPTSVVGRGRSFDLLALGQLMAAIRKGGYSVVHAHGYKAMVLVGIARLLRRFSILKTEHGRVEYTDGSLLQRWAARTYRSAENFAARASRTTIVYVTQDLRDFSRREHRGIRSEVIYNGIDVEKMSRLSRPSELARETFNVVVLARLEPVKAVDQAIRAIADAAIPGDMLLHIVGDGPLRAMHEDLAARLGVRERVRFHGFRSDGATFAAHADALLIPSLHEGLPYTLLEALSQDTPVVAYAVGGLAEVLTHEETALLAKPGRPAELAQCLVRLYSSAELRERIAGNAKRLLLRAFTIESMGAAYVAAYSRRPTDAAPFSSPSQVK